MWGIILGMNSDSDVLEMLVPRASRMGEPELGDRVLWLGVELLKLRMTPPSRPDKDVGCSESSSVAR